MKIFLYVILSFSLLFSASVENKIKKSKKALSSKKIQYKKMDKQLSSVAKKIYAAKKEQKKLNSKLEKLATNIKNNETAFKRLQKKDEKYAKNLSTLNGNIDKKQKKFLDLVAKKFSLALALEELKQPTQDSVMMREAYKLYEQKNTEEIEKLTKEMDFLNTKKGNLQSKKSNIQKAIGAYETESSKVRRKSKTNWLKT